MPTNLTPNQRINQSETTERETWASPQPNDSGWVEFEKSDIYPERKKRLSDYISDKTHGKVERDSNGQGKNAIPISYNENDQKKKLDEYNQELSEAVNLFNSLSDEYQNESDNKDNKLPEDNRVNNRLLNNSKWGSIGKKAVFEETAKKITLENPSVIQSEAFKQFLNANGTINWDKYFEEMKKIGIGLSETSSREHKAKYSLGNYGAPLSAHAEPFKKKEIKTVQEILLEAANVSEIPETLQNNDKSFGQLNSPTKPFYFGGNLNGSLELSALLLEIWIQVLVKVTISSNLLHIGQIALGNTGDKQWNNVTLGPKHGHRYKMGSSGYHDSMIDGLDEANLQNRVDTSTIQASLQKGVLVQPAVRETLKTVEDLLNFPKYILDELNIYYPRHTLSVLQQNRDSKDDVFLLNSGTVYLQTIIAGFGKLVVNVASDFRSQGYYRNLFHELIRSKAYYKEFRNNWNVDSGYFEKLNSKIGVFEILKDWMGQNDKIMKFANHLSHIGDISIADGAIGAIAFSENKVPLNNVSQHPSLRLAKSRWQNKFGYGNFSPLSMHALPSLEIKTDPKILSMIIDHKIESTPLLKLQLEAKIKKIDVAIQQIELDPFADRMGVDTILGDLGIAAAEEVDQIYELVIHKEKLQKQIEQLDAQPEAIRFSPEDVQKIENELEAEYVPFYIQDLRTNEIIAFHAFLNSIEDSYQAEWNSIKGFGRIEPAQIYGGATRSIGCSFTIVPMNNVDFNIMWEKIDKLTTLVYPQWSRGTRMEMDTGDGLEKFYQPFSQVPTASPLCRIRVGDLFKSNYSKEAMQRMMHVKSDSKLLKSTGDDANPILKSFKSGMGRGITVAITSIGFDWKLNTMPWNLEPGQKAPRMCEISLGLTPMHDITPGLDADGYNRAPIYGISGDMRTDVWDTEAQKELNNKIIKDRDAALKGQWKPE